jgi:hypothetical protein
MINLILTNLSTGWTFMRWLRLGLGVVVAFQAVVHNDALAGLVSALFFVQVITNRGGCGGAYCVNPKSRQTNVDHKAPAGE